MSSPTGLEVPVGLGIGALSAAVAVGARRGFAPETSVPPFVRRGLFLPLDIAADAVDLTRLLVTGRAFRADCGRVDQVEITDTDATRIWAVLLASAAPGSLAVDVEERDTGHRDTGQRDIGQRDTGLVLLCHRLTDHHRATADLARR